MIQSLTKPQEGETAAESIQIALAASAPNGNNTLISPLHTPEGSRHGSDEPAAAGAAAMPAPAAASTAAAVEPEAPQGHRPRRGGRPGHAAALLVRRLPRPAARAAGEWWFARRLACIVDVGVTGILLWLVPLELANVYKL